MSVGVVFLAMAILTFFLYALKGVSQIFSSKKKDVQKVEVEENEILLPLLTAAAYAALNKRVKIHKVHIHREPYVERWSYAGRMDIHLSHQKSGVNQ